MEKLKKLFEQYEIAQDKYDIAWSKDKNDFKNLLDNAIDIINIQDEIINKLKSR